MTEETIPTKDEQEAERVLVYAFDDVKQAIHADPNGYGWGWQCNLAMAAYDEGIPHKLANKIAARFMRSCFEIDMWPRCLELFGKDWDETGV